MRSKPPRDVNTFVLPTSYDNAACNLNECKLNIVAARIGVHPHTEPAKNNMCPDVCAQVLRAGRCEKRGNLKGCATELSIVLGK